MRLIDADKMKLEVNNENPIVVYYSKEIEEWRDSQPTVNAIPVEWIEEWIKTCIPHYDYDRMTYIADVYEMLDDWMEENK